MNTPYRLLLFVAVFASICSFGLSTILYEPQTTTRENPPSISDILGSSKALAAGTDNVSISNIQLLSWSQAGWRVIVVAATDAQPGTVTLYAEVKAGHLELSAGKMQYNESAMNYSVDFQNMKTRPTAVVVKSSGGGSSTAIIEGAPAREPVQAAEPDRVDIIWAQWQPIKKRKWRVIVKATSDAPPGTVTLTAKVFSGDFAIRAGEMEFKEREGYYSVVFVNVKRKTPPDKVVVNSSGGGTATSTVKHFKDDS